MTDEIMNLRGLVENTPDAELLREMIPDRGSGSFAAERLMELEVGALAGAGHGEKSLERPVRRNSLPRTPIRGLSRPRLADPCRASSPSSG